MDSVPAMPEPRAGDRFTLRPWTLNAGDLALVQESASSVWPGNGEMHARSAGMHAAARAVDQNGAAHAGSWQQPLDDQADSRTIRSR